MNPLDDKQVEKILGNLPVFERDKKAERIFFEKLHRMAVETKPAAAWFFWPRLRLAGSFVALFILAVGTVWAYQPSTTRGHFLYPWKQAAEKVELAFAFTSLQKVDAHLQFSDRRLKEAEYIVGNSTGNPALTSWLLPLALAHEEDIHLDSPQAVNLALTLGDMRSEISQASAIVEKSLTKTADASRALEKIELTADRHLEALVKIEKKAAPEVKKIVKKVADEVDEEVARVVEAREVVSEALVRKEENVKVQFARREEKKTEKKVEREENAQQEIQETIKLFQALPAKDKEVFAEKIEMALEALEAGKFGRAEGLSRALQNRIEQFPEKSRLDEQKEQEEKEEKARREKSFEEFREEKNPQQRPEPRPEVQPGEKRQERFKEVKPPEEKLPKVEGAEDDEDEEDDALDEDLEDVEDFELFDVEEVDDEVLKEKSIKPHPLPLFEPKDFKNFDDIDRMEKFKEQFKP